MFELLALGTAGFWIMTVIVFFIITALVESDSGFWATVILVGSVLGINKLYELSLFTVIKTHPGHVAALTGIYFLTGIVWSVAKWYFYLHKKVVRYNNERGQFLRSVDATEMTPALASEFQNYVSIAARPIAASECKADLIRWASYWPFSVVGTILNDVVCRTWEHIYEMLQSTYQKIADNMFKTAAQDRVLANQHRLNTRSK